MFIKTTIKDSRKVKSQALFVFLDIAKFADFWWKNADVSRTQGGYHVIYLFFASSSHKVNCAKLHRFRIWVTDFREGEGAHFCPPPIREQPQKSPSWIRWKYSTPNSINKHLRTYDFFICLKVDELSTPCASR